MEESLIKSCKCHTPVSVTEIFQNFDAKTNQTIVIVKSIHFSNHQKH